MPTRDTAWPPGTPCWLDYNAIDVEAAQAFYQAVFGWTYTDGDPEFGGYLTCELRGRAAAGMMPQRGPSQAPSWTTYFATDDATATAGEITAAGGTLLAPPMDVGPLGRMAVALDPQEHSFGIWQAGVHTGVQIFNEPGALVWNDAAVKDIGAARSFYSQVFGFTFDDIPGAGGYGTFSTEDRPLGGLGGQQPGSATGWTVCFSVASADAAVAAVTRAGGSVSAGPNDSPFGRFAAVKDAWGASFSLMQLPPD